MISISESKFFNSKQYRYVRILSIKLKFFLRKYLIVIAVTYFKNIYYFCIDNSFDN